MTSTASSFFARTSAGTGSAARWFFRQAAAFVNAFEYRRRRRQTLFELQRLDNRMLSDIGIGHADIYFHADKAARESLHSQHRGSRTRFWL